MWLGYVRSGINWSRFEFQLWMKTVSIRLLLPSSWVCRVQTKAFYQLTIWKDKHCNNPCDPKWAKARLASPQEEKFQTYEKDNNTNKKNCIYLEAFRMSTKQLQLFFFLQLQSGIQLTEQQLFHRSCIRDNWRWKNYHPHI